MRIDRSDQCERIGCTTSRCEVRFHIFLTPRVFTWKNRRALVGMGIISKSIVNPNCFRCSPLALYVLVRALFPNVRCDYFAGVSFFFFTFMGMCVAALGGPTDKSKWMCSENCERRNSDEHRTGGHFRHAVTHHTKWNVPPFLSNVTLVQVIDAKRTHEVNAIIIILLFIIIFRIWKVGVASAHFSILVGMGAANCKLSTVQN